ncbi:glycosyltransferase family 4 protein [Idiomarina sp.]|uniref:glycosyltransferase family 4 protein n=1 Tax=Idiomarina sp. TaxID=1874361 RepID=UPI0025C694E8|nr:glycosyltransferase family 4 protein [Idiomarina sp.]NQZ04546.1 glycosyltransferase family 4 protein [Idiomarina sp.]
MEPLKGKRLLMIAHGHPDFNKGGAEIAAYRLYKELRDQGSDAYFLARTQLAPHGGAAFSHRADGREILFHTNMDDGFIFSNVKTRHLWKDFAELLSIVKPDIVHLHHYFLLGVEIFQVIKNVLPNCRVILTLHEYLAICHQHGQMLKTNGKLCYKANARDCNRCFPDFEPGDFLLREHYIKQQFAHVDHFVSPSAFLKQRYVDWGLANDQIHVIENGQLPLDQAPEKRPQNVIKLGYFGQLNPVKGIDVLLKAIGLLEPSVRSKLHLEIHGANFDQQTSDFQRKIKKLIKPIKRHVTFVGSYEPHELTRIMSTMHWAVVPSTWWENSPMVIQEAQANHLPLIVSDIGGMVEKVEHEVNGLTFRVGSPVALAETLTRVVDEPELFRRCCEGVKPPLTIFKSLEAHLPLYFGH